MSSRVNGLVESARERPPVDLAFEERVAIMIYLGGLTEDEAQLKAYRCCYHRTQDYLKRDGTVEHRQTLVAPPKPPKPKKPPEEPQQMDFDAFKAAARKKFGEHWK